MAELLETVAVSIGGADDLECPFPHRKREHKEKNKIPPEVANSSGALGTSLKGDSFHVVLVDIDPPYECLDGQVVDKVGFSPHHLIPGNEIWNDKGHPLHEWIHKKKGKVKGDIGYENNEYYNGIDLPGNFKFPGWKASVGDQAGYAFAAMKADKKMRQFHDAHKAYSDLVWNALEKISTKLDHFVEQKGCGKRNCPAAKEPKFDPPYDVLAQLEGVAIRLKSRLWGGKKGWIQPLFTSRFALMYKTGGEDQEEARQKLARLRDRMGRPTDG